MSCKICEGMKEKDNLHVVYEDDTVLAIIPKKPAALGHIRIYPKQHFARIEEVPDEIVEHMFFVASYSATALFEYLGAEGTNIIANNGPFQPDNIHFCINAIARKQNDGLELTPKPKPDAKKDLDDAYKRIKDKADYIGQDTPKKKTGTVKEKTKKEKIEGDENHLLKQLKRTP